MKAYPEDLRKKIVQALDRGTPDAETARGVSLSSVKRYARIARQGGSLAPKKGSGGPREISKDVEKTLEEDVEEYPSATTSDRRRFLERLTGKTLSDSTVRRLLREAEARTRKALIEAMGVAISAVTDRDASGFFEHCGCIMTSTVNACWRSSSNRISQSSRRLPAPRCPLLVLRGIGTRE